MLYSKVIQLYINIYIYIHFFHILFHYGLSQDIEYSPLFIHSIYNSLHLLIPNSHSIPPPLSSPLATTSQNRSVFEDTLVYLSTADVLGPQAEEGRPMGAYSLPLPRTSRTFFHFIWHLSLTLQRTGLLLHVRSEPELALSTLAFGAGQGFVVGFPAHCRAFCSIPAFYPLDVPVRQPRWPPVEKHWIKLTRYEGLYSKPRNWLPLVSAPNLQHPLLLSPWEGGSKTWTPWLHDSHWVG